MDVCVALTRSVDNVTPADSWVRVRHLQSPVDGGILDPDDHLAAVADDRDQILAIYDEQDVVPSTSIVRCDSSATSAESGGDVGAPSTRRRLENAVEVKSVDVAPASGLLVLDQSQAPPLSPLSAASSSVASPTEPNGRVSPFLHDGFVRSSARHSCLDEKWRDAAHMAEQRYWTGRASPDAADEWTDVTLTLTRGSSSSHLGVQVAPEYVANGRLSAVRVTHMQEGSRASTDGQLSIGDRIIEINGRPVYQMSLIRAQTYLHEASQEDSMTLKLLRRGGAPVQSTQADAATASRKPLSALQKANTLQIGDKVLIELVKDGRGLGFTVTSRETAVGDRPFYIKTVLPHGAAAADGRLTAGDRLLQINDTSLAGFEQAQVVELLRSFGRGDRVALLVSRIADSAVRQQSPPPSSPTAAASPAATTSVPAGQILHLEIALNETGSAGLGVSVKGRTTLASDCAADCGIFVKSIIHGSAAFKDGRLRVNDQLIAINDVRLENLSNREAMNLIGRSMQQIGASASSIRLSVARHSPSAGSVARSPSGAIGRPDEAESFYLDLETARQMHKSAVQSSTVVRADSDETTTIIIAEDCRVWQPESNLDSGDDATTDDEAAVADDPFKRETVGRQSMSEKRRHGVGAKADPSHSKVYQRIKHQRQTSAPALSGVQQALHVPRSTTAPSDGRGLTACTSSSPPTKLSNSVESLLTKKAAAEEPMIHELAARGLAGDSKKSAAKAAGKKVGQRVRPTNDSFRQAVDRSYQSSAGLEVGVDVGDAAGRLVESAPTPARASGRAQSLPRATRDRDRRKSTGGGFHAARNWLSKWGSGRSRESSPEKARVVDSPAAQSRAAKAAADEQARIREQYEKLKRQQRDAVDAHAARRPWSPGAPPSDHMQRQRSATAAAPPQSPFLRFGRTESAPTNEMAIHRVAHHHLPPYRGPSFGAAADRQHSPAPRSYQEMLGPPWFAIANDHTRFYRSLDRVAPPRGAVSRTGQRAPSPSRLQQADAARSSATSLRRHTPSPFVSRPADRLNDTSGTSAPPRNPAPPPPPPPHIGASSSSNRGADAAAYDYRQHLRPARLNGLSTAAPRPPIAPKPPRLFAAQDGRPASAFVDYRLNLQPTSRRDGPPHGFVMNV